MAGPDQRKCISAPPVRLLAVPEIAGRQGSDARPGGRSADGPAQRGIHSQNASHPIAFDPVRRGTRDYLSGEFILDLDPGVGDAWKEQFGIEDEDSPQLPSSPPEPGIRRSSPACAGSTAALWRGAAMAWCGRTRPMPGPDQPLCPSGMPGDLTRAQPGSRSARWQTDQILSPVRLPYPSHWKHVAVMITGLDFKAITIPPPSVHIAVALG